MATVRNQFHELGNWHNKISLAAIVTRESLAEENLTKLPEAQLRKIIAKAVGALNKVEKYVINADRIVEGIKPFIYEKIGPDTGIPLQSK